MRYFSHALRIGLDVSSIVVASEFIKKLRAPGLNIRETTATTAAGIRGTLGAAVIDPKTGKRTAVNHPGAMVFCQAE